MLLNADRDKIIRTLDRLRSELTETQNLLIYYAGHGFLDRESETGFWLPADAEEDTQTDWISMSTITGTVKAMSAKDVMIVADSCYSGTLVRAAPVRIESGGDRSLEIRRLAQKRFRTALVSGGLEPVIDGGGDGYSVFARAFINELRQNQDVLDGTALFRSIRRPVVVNADQTPEYSDIRKAGHEGGDFLFLLILESHPAMRRR